MTEDKKVDSELLSEAKMESAELLEQMNKLAEQLVMNIDSKEDISSDLINSFFRSVHTLKGIARILKSIEVEEFIHVYEDILGIFRQDTSKITSNCATQLMDGAYLISDLFEGIFKAKVSDELQEKRNNFKTNLKSLLNKLNNTQNSNDKDISDDEAQKLLAEMEGESKG